MVTRRTSRCLAASLLVLCSTFLLIFVFSSTTSNAAPLGQAHLTLTPPADLPYVARQAAPAQSSEYATRKAQLLTTAAQPFVDDPKRNVETGLDGQSFQEINKLACPKPVNNPHGWSIEMRTGGRPFMNFDRIKINGSPWALVPCTPGISTITQQMLDAHYAAGKTVNRMWFIHPTRDGSGFPVALVMTPDGFFNAGGAHSPKLQGAALRLGFIGEPFDTAKDYVQHVDEVSLSIVDDTTLLIVYSIHSAAGEGVLEVELSWDYLKDQPELRLRSAHAVRTNLPQSVNRLGFAGFDFMKGPTLSGLLSQFATPEGGIAAFHDGRNLFVVYPNGSFKRELLIAPVLTSTVIREEIANNVIVGSKIVLDQPQNVVNYFSKFPTPRYDQRTDLILKLTAGTNSPLLLRRAQTSVDLASANPEANETVNVFYATDMSKSQLYEFSYILTLAAEDFDKLYAARRQGVVFISNRSESWSRLYFQALDATLAPLGSPIPLTDAVISDTHRPSASADGRFILFDANDYAVSTRQRIYALNLDNGAVRRLTVDPFGASNDYGASFNAERTQISAVTDRHGTPTRLITATVATGLGGGFGNEVTIAFDADWCHSANQIAYVNASGLFIRDIATSTSMPVISGSDIRKPRFSPNCDEIVYVKLMAPGVWAVHADGTNNRQLLTNGDNPAWVDENHLIVQITANSNADLYLLTMSNMVTTTLTTAPAIDSEPAYVKAVGPKVMIKSPTNPWACTTAMASGFVASVGAPDVKLNGMSVSIQGDEWSIPLNLSAGIHTLTATVTDSATGMSSQDQITTDFRKCVFLFLPLILKNQ